MADVSHYAVSIALEIGIECSLTLYNCDSRRPTLAPFNGHEGKIMLISVEEANYRLQADRAVLIDVREVKEWDAGHIQGAQHLALSEFDSDGMDAEASYMLICLSGGRSGKAMIKLHEAGFEAVNVEGGMLAWAAAGLPMRRDDGEAPVVLKP